MAALQDKTPCDLVGTDRRFREVYLDHHQGDEYAEGRRESGRARIEWRAPDTT